MSALDTSPVTAPVARALVLRLALALSLSLSLSLSLVLASAPAGATPAAAVPLSGACPTSDGVTVVVDFAALGGGVVVRCAPGAPATGFDALREAGFAVTPTRNPGFLCRIDGAPGNDPCVDTPPPDAHWSYWYAPRGGQWNYSGMGGTGRQPIQGTVEGWRFSDGSQRPPGIDPPAAAVIIPTTSPPRPATTPPTRPPTRPPTTSPLAPGALAGPAGSAPGSAGSGANPAGMSPGGTPANGTDATGPAADPAADPAAGAVPGGAGPTADDAAAASDASVLGASETATAAGPRSAGTRARRLAAAAADAATADAATAGSAATGVVTPIGTPSVVGSPAATVLGLAVVGVVAAGGTVTHRRRRLVERAHVDGIGSARRGG